MSEHLDEQFAKLFDELNYLHEQRCHARIDQHRLLDATFSALQRLAVIARDIYTQQQGAHDGA